MDILFAAASDTDPSSTPSHPLPVRGLSLIAKYAASATHEATNAEPAISSTPQQRRSSLAMLLSSAQGSSSGGLGLLSRIIPAAGSETAAVLHSTAPPQDDTPASEVQEPSVFPVREAAFASSELARERTVAESSSANCTSVTSVSVPPRETSTNNESPITVQPESFVGLRPPQNNKRKSVALPQLVTASQVYRSLCRSYDVRSNSRVVGILEQHDAYTSTPHNPLLDLKALDLSLCMLRDKGMLVVVELLRLCPNLQSLNLSHNDITNEGVEYLAHAVMEGVASSSFEVPEDDDALHADGTKESTKKDDSLRARAADAGIAFSNIRTCSQLGFALASLNVAGNRISLGGVRLLQLLAEKLPSLVDVVADGARVDASELEELALIVAENRQSRDLP